MLNKLLEGLEPEEKEELSKQLVGLSSKEIRKAVRDYKLKLDCPELTDEERQPLPEELFNDVEDLVFDLLEVTEEIVNLDYSVIHPNAKAFLLSQVKKSIGMLGGVVNKNQ
jgi:hypothetical protein